MYESAEAVPFAAGPAPTAAYVAVGASSVVRVAVLVSVFGYIRLLNAPASLAAAAATACAALLFLALQRPWIGSRRISQPILTRIAMHGATYAAEVLLFFSALKYLGVIHTVLLCELSSISYVSIASLFFAPARRAMSVQKRWGTIVMVFTYLMLLIDLPSVDSGPRLLQQGSWWIPFAASSSAFGVLCALLSNVASIARAQLSRSLNTEVGGAKRLHAFSVSIAAVILFPLSLAHYLWMRSEMLAWPGALHFWEVSVACGVFCLAAHYYAMVAARARGRAEIVALLASLAPLAFMILASFYPFSLPIHYSFFTPVIAVLHAVGLYLLLSKSALENILLPSTATPGAMMGADGGVMKPRSSIAAIYSPAAFSSFFASLVQRIREDPDARHIFYYLVINFSFMFMELAYGIWNNSLGLVSDACHMLFDCIALLIGLSGLVIAEWRPNSSFSFGYKRVNVLSAFINAIFLVFIAISVVMEALARFFEPVHVHHDRLLLVSVLGFLVNLVGLFVFHTAHEAAHGHSHGGGGHSHGGGGHSHGGGGHSHGGGGHSHGHQHEEHGHSHGHAHEQHSHGHAHEQHSHGHEHSLEDGRGHGHDEALSGVYLHILGDTLGSVGVIVSSILIEYLGWMIADPICSLCIGLVIFVSVVPLLKSSGATLLQCAPDDFVARSDKLLASVEAIEGVVAVEVSNFWSIDGEDTIGTVVLQTEQAADRQAVLQRASALFKTARVEVTIEIRTGAPVIRFT